MKLTLQMFRILTGFLLLAATGTLAASPDTDHPINGSGPGATKQFPVLPMPRHAAPTEKMLTGIGGNRVTWAGLDTGAEARLSWHWKKIGENHRSGSLAGNKAHSISIGLLGKDQRFDQLLSTLAAEWMQKIGDEGYILFYSDRHPVIAAQTETGIFYGMQTWKQLTRAGWDREVLIADWPAFPTRVIYDDISRGPISTVAYIKNQIERMAELKINYLSFYIEHIVQPLSHPDFAPADGKLSIAQIKELSAYASKFYMQLIGSFQSFGHFEKILSLPQYTSLGATSTLISPIDPRAKKFLEDVIGELCDAFNAPWFNVNCDETFDLGQGSTKAAVDSMGAAAFYAGHLQFLYDIVKRHGKKMMMWGDFAIEHEAVLDLLPKDIIYLTWEYGDQPSFDHWIKPFASRGLEYMVCPGILNTYRMFPDMAMAKANISGFAAAGAARHATGVITTIWDDGGAYLFSGDWYGVYTAAEKSWTTDTSANASFDSRYELNAYGTQNGNYVKALFTLMKLRALPITYNLTDRLWQQKLLPDQGKELIVNNKSASEAKKIIANAAALVASARPMRNKTDIRTLSYTIDQYALMIESRLRLAEIAAGYNRALSSNSSRENIILFTNFGNVLDKLKGRYVTLKDRFRQAWLDENQHYWLDTVLRQYDKKIADLDELSANLQKAITALQAGTPLPPANAVRLAIRESSSYYFQNWMLAGLFPVAGKNNFPSFLYADTKEYNKPPAPGDFTRYNGKLYRWRKFASADGGIIDLHEYYPQQQPGFVYAYCLLRTDSASAVPAFATSNQAMEIYCNGRQLYTNNSEPTNVKTTLPLQAGINHILLKLKNDNAKDWIFTFHLADDLYVTNHKHKYQLNANGLYDAE